MAGKGEVRPLHGVRNESGLPLRDGGIRLRPGCGCGAGGVTGTLSAESRAVLGPAGRGLAVLASAPPCAWLGSPLVSRRPSHLTLSAASSAADTSRSGPSDWSLRADLGHDVSPCATSSLWTLARSPFPHCHVAPSRSLSSGGKGQTGRLRILVPRCPLHTPSLKSLAPGPRLHYRRPRPHRHRSPYHRHIHYPCTYHRNRRSTYVLYIKRPGGP